MYRSLTILAALTAALAAFAAGPAAAQTDAPSAPAAAAAPPAAIDKTGAVAAPAAAKGAAAAAKGRECTRLPLSDIQFGREYTIKVAREKLEDYAQQETRRRGWKGYTRSAETASCEDYLYLPIGGQEYKCLVTATFCRK